MLASNRKEPGCPYILVVEDCGEQRDLLRHTLEKKKYVVEVASNAEKALSMIRRRKPILIFSDIMMPGMNGFEFCRAIKENPKWRDVPVILLTGVWDRKCFVRGLESGADCYATKPWDKNWLLSRTAEILENGLSWIKPPSTGEHPMVRFAGEKFDVPMKENQLMYQLLSTFDISIDQKRKNLIAQLELKKSKCSPRNI